MEDDTAKLLPDHNADSESKSIQVQDADHSGDLERSPDDRTRTKLIAPPHSDNIQDATPPHSKNSTEDSENDEEQKGKTPMTLAQKLTFVGIAIAYLSVFTSFSVLAPFFPYEAEKKGVNPTETGLVFSIFALVSFIASPIFGKYLPVIGGKFMFLSGSFLSAGCNILFGMPPFKAMEHMPCSNLPEPCTPKDVAVFNCKIEGKTMFLIYCFVIRTVEGLGSAATLTAGMAICANVYPDNVAQMSGILELFIGLGFTVGPPLGSLFYGIGGFKLPFLVLGGTAIAFTILNIFIIPSDSSSREEEKRAGSVLEVLKIPAVFVVLITNVWASACMGFIDPTLSLHLTSDPLNINPSLIGVLFLLIGGMYALFSPIWGYVADKRKTTRLMMVMGSYLTGIALLLIGPSPLLNLPGQLWIIILSLGLFGFASGICIMPAFLDLLMSAKWYGLPDDLSTQSIISGLFNGAYSLGSFIGPIVGGALVGQFGFVWSSTYFAGGSFVVMIMICLFGVWEFQCGKGRRKPNHLKSVPYLEILQDSQQVVNA